MQHERGSPHAPCPELGHLATTPGLPDRDPCGDYSGMNTPKKMESAGPEVTQPIPSSPSGEACTSELAGARWRQMGRIRERHLIVLEAYTALMRER